VGSIFISYRRADTEADTGRLYDSLMSRLPEARIFMDIDSLEPGEDFVERLKKTMSSAQVVLVVIGRAWLTASDTGGHRRLENPDDLVRQEIASALERHAHVIPVLVQGAVMPSEHDLPSAVRSLARRQAVELRHTRWGDDVHHLVERIEYLAAFEPVTNEHESPGHRWRWLTISGPLARRSGAAVLTVIVVTSIGLWRFYGPTPVPTPLERASQAAGSPPTETVRPPEEIATRLPSESQDVREGQKQPSAAGSPRPRPAPTPTAAAPKDTAPDRESPAKARPKPRDIVAAADRPPEEIGTRPPNESQDAGEGQKQPPAVGSPRPRPTPTSPTAPAPKDTTAGRDSLGEARPMPRDTVAAQHAAIESVLDRYADGYARRDPAAIRRVWPSAPAGLARELADARSYRLELIDKDIVLEGDSARVTCVRQITAQLAVGREQSHRAQTVISLNRGPAGWLITDVR